MFNNMAEIEPPYTAPEYIAARNASPATGDMGKVKGIKRATPMVGLKPLILGTGRSLKVLSLPGVKYLQVIQ